jgi:hypothetical protein
MSDTQRDFFDDWEDDYNAKGSEKVPQRAERLLKIFAAENNVVSLNKLQHVYGFHVTRGRHEKQYLCDRGHVIESRNGEYIYKGQLANLVKVDRDLASLYYQTPHWKQVRSARIHFDRGACCQCNSVNDLQVHHWFYELFNEHTERDLMTLCAECHQALHANPMVSIHFPRFLPLAVIERIKYRHD